MQLTSEETKALDAALARGDHAEVKRITERARERAGRTDSMSRDELKRVASEVYDIGSALTPDERKVIVAEVKRLDGGDVSRESDVYICGIYLGCLRRAARRDAMPRSRVAEDAARQAMNLDTANAYLGARPSRLSTSEDEAREAMSRDTSNAYLKKGK